MKHALQMLVVAAAWIAPVALASGEESASPSAATRALGFEDQEAVKNPGNLAVSRDGKLLAYTLEKQVFVVPLAGGAPRAVTSAGSSASDPYWSKDGSTLYFLSDRSGKSQLWRLPLATFGEAHQVTTLEQGVDAIRFSPDEARLLLSFTDSALQVPAEPEKPPTPKPFVITRLEFKEDAGEGYLTGDRAEHLHALDIASGKLTQLTSGAYSESDAGWSADGRQVVFVSNREQESDATYRTDLWLVDAGNTDKGASLLRLTNDERTKSDPAFSPDGRSIAFLVAEDGVYGAPQVAVMPATRRRGAGADDAARSLGERLPLFGRRPVDLFHVRESRRQPARSRAARGRTAGDGRRGRAKHRQFRHRAGRPGGRGDRKR